MRSLPSPPTAHLVTEDLELERLCDRWLECAHLALDTEFIRTRTFFPKLGLVQVADPEAIYLLDAVALEDWTPFVEVLRSESVVKVVHSPSEDLELFRHYFDLLLAPMADTQIAATLSGVAPMPGYSKLILEKFGVDLPKGEQRSNWLKRPLTESQQLYAGLDVAYLLPAWEMLRQQLAELGRREWFDEEMGRLAQQCELKNDSATIYRRLSRSNLNERQAGALFDLVDWREKQARKRDLPRKFVLGDDVLLEVARLRPTSADSLGSVRSLGAGQLKRLGSRLVDVVRAAEPRDLKEERRDHSKVSKSRLQPVRECVEAIAEETAIPTTFLASKRAMEKLVRRTSRGSVEEVPEELAGWRWDEFGDQLSAAAAGDQKV